MNLKRQFGVIAALMLMALIITSVAQSRSTVAGTTAAVCASGPAPASARALSSVKANKVQTLCKSARRHLSTITFWNSKAHRWTLYLRHENLSCAQLNDRNLLRGPEALCFTARTEVRHHSQRLATLVPRIQRLAAEAVMQADLAATKGRRACMASVETPHSSHPYTQQGGGGGHYWGKYQYDEGTWRVAVQKASAYYHTPFPVTKLASQAAPWEQEAVTAFAVAHSGVLGWDPWQECR